MEEQSLEEMTDQAALITSSILAEFKKKRIPTKIGIESLLNIIVAHCAINYSEEEMDLFYKKFKEAYNHQKELFKAFVIHSRLTKPKVIAGAPVSAMTTIEDDDT